MSTRSILVSYAGHPYTFNSLMPDNGLANLAGSLLCAGHDVVVRDYGTVDHMGEMLPPDLRAQARSVFRSAVGCVKAGRSFGEDVARGFSLLDAELRKAGMKRCQRIAAELCKEVADLGADFVGFKLWNGDGFTGSIEIAERIKATCKNVKVFAGGPHVDIFREKIMEATDIFDAVVCGEAERTIVELAEFVQGERDLAGVANAIFREDGHIVANVLDRIQDLNELPMPCYDTAVYPSMSGDRKIKIVVLDESRGCPFSCYFCIHPVKSGRKLRAKDAHRVIEEMEKVVIGVGTRAFRYAGSATPPRLAKHIADLILEKEINVAYTAFGNAAYGDGDGFEAMKRSGCRALFFGIESGSEGVLQRSMGKSATLSGIADTIARSKKAGLFTVGSIIFPAPLETNQSEEETFRFLCEVMPDSVVVQFPIVYPQTEWAEHPERFGLSFLAEEYTRAAMTYKAKPLMPSSFWDDLPFSINRRDFRTVRAEASRFEKRLEQAGILTSVSDDLALMAELAGYRGREREFRDLTRAAFFCGEVQWIEERVAQINGAAREARRDAGVPLQRAPGLPLREKPDS